MSDWQPSKRTRVFWVCFFSIGIVSKWVLAYVADSRPLLMVLGLHEESRSVDDQGIYHYYDLCVGADVEITARSVSASEFLMPLETKKRTPLALRMANNKEKT